MLTKVRLLCLLLLLVSAVGCQRQKYVYILQEPVNVYASPNDKSQHLGGIADLDTVRYNHRKKRNGYVYIESSYMAGYSYRPKVRKVALARVYHTSEVAAVPYSSSRRRWGSSARTTSIYKPVHVRSHLRRTKSGKVVTVKSHYRSKPSRSSSYSRPSRSTSTYHRSSSSRSYGGRRH